MKTISVTCCFDGWATRRSRVLGGCPFCETVHHYDEKSDERIIKICTLGDGKTGEEKTLAFGKSYIEIDDLSPFVIPEWCDLDGLREYMEKNHV